MAEPTTFTSFDVLAPGSSPAEVVTALGDGGSPCEEENHVFVAIELVRSLAGDGADAAWNEQFAGMIGYAGSKGWLSEDGTMIKAHLAES